MSNSLDPDQAQSFVRPDLGPNYLQKLAADDTSRQSKELLNLLYLSIFLTFSSLLFPMAGFASFIFCCLETFGLAPLPPCFDFEMDRRSPKCSGLANDSKTDPSVERNR